MKKQVKVLTCLLALCGMLAACSSNDDMAQTEDKVENKANEVKDDAEDSIDNVMSYFKKQGVELADDANIDKMDFAAYEGRTFTYNGNKGYLYRVKSNDENMQKVLKEAKDKGKVKVSIDNKEMEYAAKVNGNYLLLYDTTANMDGVINAFPNYTVPAQQPATDTPQTSSGKEAADGSTTNSDQSDVDQNKSTMNNGTNNTTNSSNSNANMEE